MDKVRDFLVILKKHHFWVLCGVVALVSPVCFFLASSSLSKAYATGKTTVDGKFTGLNTLASSQNPPNVNFKPTMEAEHVKLRDDTYRAWELSHKQQSDVLVWNLKIFGDQFGTHVKLRSPRGAIDTRFRDIALNYFPKQFPQLFDIVQVREPVNNAPEADKEGDDGPGPGSAVGLGQNANRESVHYVGMVAWSEKARNELTSRYLWPGRPTSLQVWYAQEDLWVYDALLRIIADTNKTATEHLFAPIKKIETLEVGQQASQLILASTGAASSSANSSTPGAVASTDAPSAASPPTAGGAGTAIGGAGGDEAAKSPDEKLRHLRYVDANGTPIPAGTAAPFPQFNMVPVWMSLLMNEQEIPNLLVNCANYPLRVEVRRVRMNPSKGAPGILIGEKTIPSAAALGSVQSTAKLAGAAGGEAISAEVEPGPSDVQVEIVGFVYIFNPPDKALMVKPEGAEPGAAPVETAPIDGAPIDGAPIDGAPVEAAPVEGAVPTDAGAAPNAAVPAADAAPANEAAAPGEPATDAAEAAAPAEPAAVPAPNP